MDVGGVIWRRSDIPENQEQQIAAEQLDDAE
jgi:hypothetical protein